MGASMSYTRTLRHVPDDTVDQVIQDFKSEGASSVDKTKEEDGNGWMVVATFPDQ
jgi:hypothetical protein